MKQHFQSLIVVLFVLAMSMPAQAITGNELAEYCKNVDRGAFLEGLCEGLIGGFDYGYSYHDGGRAYCVPKDVSQGQISKVGIKYLNEHPEKLHERYEKLILEALKEAFPCN